MSNKIPKAKCRRCVNCVFILDGKVVCDMQSFTNKDEAKGEYVPIPEFCKYFIKRSAKNERQ